MTDLMPIFEALVVSLLSFGLGGMAGMGIDSYKEIRALRKDMRKAGLIR